MVSKPSISSAFLFQPIRDSLLSKSKRDEGNLSFNFKNANFALSLFNLFIRSIFFERSSVFSSISELSFSIICDFSTKVD